MSKITTLLVIACAWACALVACGGSQSVRDQQNLEQQARTTLAAMQSKDPSLYGLLNRSAGYAVFPNVGAAGLVVGGAYGQGILYSYGHPIGVVNIKEASAGAQVGAQSYGELIVLRDSADVARLQAGTFQFDAKASAIALTTGAAANVQFSNGAAAFIMPKGGLMGAVAVGGQRIDYHPLAG